VEYGIILELLGNPSRCKDIGKVKLPARLENPEYLFENRPLVRREIYDTIGNHHIHRIVRQSRFFQVLDISLPEIDVCLPIAEAGSLGVDVLPSCLKLLIGHINADNISFFPGQFRNDINIPQRNRSRKKPA
jgi:hypothetical protein